MKVWITICGVCLSLPIWADDGLGHLFSTPQQRQVLQQLRDGKVEAVVKPSRQRQSQSNIQMQGYVQRQDQQPSTVWINHQPRLEDSHHADMVIGSFSKGKQSIPIKIRNQPTYHRLKPGQVYDPNKRQINDIADIRYRTRQ